MGHTTKHKASAKWNLVTHFSSINALYFFFSLYFRFLKIYRLGLYEALRWLYIDNKWVVIKLVVIFNAFMCLFIHHMNIKIVLFSMQVRRLLLCSTSLGGLLLAPKCQRKIFLCDFVSQEENSANGQM